MTFTTSQVTIAIIIPVYNEQAVIATCLDAIARQSDVPDQVIVVDNNSTDNTVAIASRYPFVTIVSETKQGISHARNKGFDTADTAVLGRIDADTIIPVDWVASIKKVYTDNTKHLAVHGTTGTARYHTPQAQIAGNIAGRFVLDWSYFPISRFMIRSHTLYGCNMTITRAAWHSVRTEVCTDDKNIHEEVDLSIHLLQKGGNIEYGQLATVLISTRGLVEKPEKFLWRLRVWPTAVRRHQRLFRKIIVTDTTS